MNNIQNSTTNSTPALQRWEEKSPTYKKDLLIKRIAIIALPILGVSIFAVGTIVFATVPLPLILALPILFTASTSFVGGPLSALLISLYLKPHHYGCSYHKEKAAKELCEEIKTTWDSIPPPTYLERKEGITREISKRSEFKKRLRDWVNYGFVKPEFGKNLLEILEKDDNDRSEYSNIKNLLDASASTQSDRQSYQQQIDAIDHECESNKREWECVMRERVIPDLPFDK